MNVISVFCCAEITESCRST